MAVNKMDKVNKCLLTYFMITSHLLSLVFLLSFHSSQSILHIIITNFP